MIESKQNKIISIAAIVSGHGRGTNLGALIEGCASGVISGRISVVIGTRANSPALERAARAGITVSVISPRKYEGNEPLYAETLQKILSRHEIDLICLAGFMRKLPQEIVNRYSGRIMNVHPALLPLFGGQGMYGERVHQAALESGMKVSGCTVHFVDENYDTGPIIAQTAVPIFSADSVATLSERVIAAEHQTYVRAVRLFAAGRLSISASRVVVSEEGEKD